MRQGEDVRGEDHRVPVIDLPDPLDARHGGEALAWAPSEVVPDPHTVSVRPPEHYPLNRPEVREPAGVGSGRRRNQGCPEGRAIDGPEGCRSSNRDNGKQAQQVSNRRGQVVVLNRRKAARCARLSTRRLSRSG